MPFSLNGSLSFHQEDCASNVACVVHTAVLSGKAQTRPDHYCPTPVWHKDTDFCNIRFADAGSLHNLYCTVSQSDNWAICNPCKQLLVLVQGLHRKGLCIGFWCMSFSLIWEVHSMPALHFSHQFPAISKQWKWRMLAQPMQGNIRYILNAPAWAGECMSTLNKAKSPLS